MPYYLENTDFIPELTEFKSVLIIPCRFCPAASTSVIQNEPYIQFFRGLLKTASYEDVIKTIQENLEDQGIRADVFRSILPHQFVLCSWTSNKREQLLEYAKKYEALLVLGCEAAVRTVQDTIGSNTCQVIPGMKSVGLMSVKPRFELPCNISLELDSVTPVQFQQEHAESV